MKDLKTDSRRRGFLKQAMAVLAAGGFVPLVFAARQNLVHGLRVERHKDGVHLVFDLSSAEGHKLFSLTKPARVVLDLKDTSLAQGVKLNINHVGPVSGVRYSMRANNQMRVVFDVDQSVSTRSFPRIYAGGQQFVVEVLPKHSSQPAVPVKSVNQAPLTARDLVIAIDAGHGGKDPGATGKRGTHEKDVVLQMARRLEKLLQNEMGYKPVMIREGDYFMPLRDRVDKARKEQADLFISLHADASPNNKAHGASVYVLSENGASSEAARLLAAKENAVDLIGGIRLNDKDELLASVLLDLSQRHTIDSSQTVAGDMHGELTKLGQMHSGKVEQAAFAVLKSPDVPSVLIETAFISNPADEKHLLTKDYQTSIVESILEGIKGYFSKNAPADSFIARADQREHTIREGETLSGIAIHYRVRLSQLRQVNSLSGSNVRAGQILKIPGRGI
ncbi:MAG: N-acetylmuramoyl-L-alanine amidase [Thiothrix sp.]|nr:MAG: N-acetylmuramoyl-L-alanine amidase [Thiothrix sp.]